MKHQKAVSSGRRKTPSTLDDFANASLRISSGRLDQSLSHEAPSSLLDSSASRRAHALNTSLNTSALGPASTNTTFSSGQTGNMYPNHQAPSQSQTQSQRWKSGLNPPYALSFQGSGSFSGSHSSLFDSDILRSKQTDYSSYNQRQPSSSASAASALNSSLRSSSNGPIPTRSGDSYSAR
jgi:hypothetical protein